MGHVLSKSRFWDKTQKAGYALGFGKYLTWEKSMAEAFGELACSSYVIERYKLPPDIKLLRSESKEMCDLKRRMGFGCRDNIADEIAARILTHEIKKLGYEGVISDSYVDGLVVFDEKKLKRI